MFQKTVNSNTQNGKDDSLLSNPFFYIFFQKLLAHKNSGERFVKEFINPKPNARILDIGCGTAAVLEYLPGDVDYTGYDLNPAYINYAAKKFKERGKFYCKNMSDLDFKKNEIFDIVLLKGLLHHLDNKESKKIFHIASNCLRPGGYVVTLDSVYFDGQSKIARYLISKDRGQYVRTEHEYSDLARAFFPEVQTTVLHNMLKVPYTHFVMKCFKSLGEHR